MKEETVPTVQVPEELKPLLSHYVRARACEKLAKSSVDSLGEQIRKIAKDLLVTHIKESGRFVKTISLDGVVTFGSLHRTGRR